MLRLFRHYFSARKALVFLAEAAAVALGCTVGAVAFGITLAPAAQPWSPLAFLILAAGFTTALSYSLYLFDLYDFEVAREDRKKCLKAIRACGLAAAVMAIATLAAPAGALPRGAVLGGGLGALLGSLAIRAAAQALWGHPSRVLLVGNGERVRALSDELKQAAGHAYEIRGVVDPGAVRVRQRYSQPGAVAGASEVLSLDEMAASLGADVVVRVADPNDELQDPAGDALLECRLRGRRVYDVAGFIERVLRRLPVGQLMAAELAYADEWVVTRTRRFFKRAFDIAVASVVALCTLPVMVVVAVLVKLDSRGPIFYCQERVGQGGRGFRLWKFRSMRVDAEKDGAVWARPDDDRVTRVGRWLRQARLDELPQIFNVLAGDMSFVGPRPERPVFVRQIEREVPFYTLREAVKPGITGWAQIRYPYGASVEDARRKLELDLYYVKNGTLLLDLAIIFHTVRHVLLGRGAR
ncbi:MAG: sugar transferase [Myxococcota bacterium]